jgi:hypothetical protein
MNADSRLLRWLVPALSTMLALAAGEFILRSLARPPSSPAAVAQALERSRRSPAVHRNWKGLVGILQSASAPGLTYELRPNLSGQFMHRPFSTNSWGLRSPEVETRKPAGVFRIVGLGDSHMFGWGVGQDELYLSILERRLNQSAAAGRRFEVVNCAVPGYNTVLEVTRFETRCAAFEPDLVVLHIVGNDLDLPLFLRAELPRPRSYLLAAIRSLVARLDETDESDEDPSGDQDDLPLLSRNPARKQPLPEAQAAARAALLRLAGRARASGFEVVVLTLSRQGAAREFLLSIVEAHGWPVLDAWPASWAELERRGLPNDEATWRREYVYLKDDHPSANANRLYAKLLWQELVRMQIAPDKGSKAWEAREVGEPLEPRQP